MSKSKSNVLLPLQSSPVYENGRQAKRPWLRIGITAIALAALGLTTGLFTLNGAIGRVAFAGKDGQAGEMEPFYSSVKTHDDVCVGGVSHSGYIGLKGDTEDTPKRSFFWYVIRSVLHVCSYLDHVLVGTSRLRTIRRRRL